ncbi:catalytic protein [Spatholobus suberectus]|nr:catalytic protein [Spatholobus suberectus]
MQVDAFTESPFKGNPAAVCLLEEEKEDKWMQGVATEFNISETCYLTRIAEPEISDISLNRPSTDRFNLRWFTPTTEVELCGHATLASAHVLFSSGLVKSNIIEFVTLSGVLTAKKVPGIDGAGASDDGFFIELDFPAVTVTEFNSADISQISAALNGAPIINVKRASIGDDLLVELASGKAVVELQPDIAAIAKCPGGGILVSGTAPPESGFDYYCRFFFPKFGINEDPFTGSAQCALAPYWARKLGKCDLSAYAASSRGGVVHVHFDEQSKRILMRGKASCNIYSNGALQHYFTTGVNSIKVEGEGDAGARVTVTSTVSPNMLAAIIKESAKEKPCKSPTRPSNHEENNTNVSDSPNMPAAMIGETTKEKEKPCKSPTRASNQEENNSHVSVGQSIFKGHQGAINLQELAKTNRMRQLELVQTQRINFNDEPSQKGSESDNKGVPDSTHCCVSNSSNTGDTGMSSENVVAYHTPPHSQRHGYHYPSPPPNANNNVNGSSRCSIMGGHKLYRDND